MESLNKIINLEKYPINDIGSLKYKELINYTRKQLDEDGCCVLPNFIKPDSIKKMKDELGQNTNIIGTGGLIHLIRNLTTIFDHVNPDITLIGLKYIYEMNDN